MMARITSLMIIQALMLALLTSTTLNYVGVLGQIEDEVPSFEGIEPGFTPPPESERTPPPPPPDALKVTELPASSLAVENDTDVDALSVTNRTEILEILPLNSSNIIEFVDEELKNNTGEGLVPSSVLENITSAEGGQPNGNLSNTTILDVLSPQELEEVTNMTVPTGEGGEALDLDEQDIPPASTSANETEDGEEVDEEEEIIPPPASTDQLSTNQTTTNETTGAAEDDQEQAEEGDETTPTPTTPSTPITPESEPSADQQILNLDNNTVDLGLNQTGELIRDNITMLNDTSINPSDDNGDETSDDNGDER